MRAVAFNPGSMKLGHKTTVYISHMAIAVLEQKEGHWVSPAEFWNTKFSLEQDDEELTVATDLNPAIFLHASGEAQSSTMTAW